MDKKLIISLLLLGFLLGWDIGICLSNQMLKEEKEKDKQYIEYLEQYVDQKIIKGWRK